MVRSSSTTNSTRSPRFKPRRLRISRGTVICPLLLIVLDLVIFTSLLYSKDITVYIRDLREVGESSGLGLNASIGRSRRKLPTSLARRKLSARGSAAVTIKVSKSKFVAGCQCLKRLYLQVHQPELAAEPDELGTSPDELRNCSPSFHLCLGHNLVCSGCLKLPNCCRAAVRRVGHLRVLRPL